MGPISHVYSTYLQRNGLAGIPLSQVRPQDALIYTTVRPNIKANCKRETMPTAKLYDAVADASSTFRAVPVGISEISGRSMGNMGAPLVGLTSVLYSLIGVGRARDSYKTMKDLEKIGDASGANVARAQIVANIFVASGSAAMGIVRIFSAVKELFELLKNPLVLSSALLTVKAVAVWASTVLLVLFYAVYAGLQSVVLYNLSKGNELREKLTNSKDPVEALRQHIDLEMFKGSSFSKEECIEMALQEGAGWLVKLEKEVEEFPWDPTDKSRRDHVCMLFSNKPEFMMAEMGKPLGYDKLTPEGKMVRFGRFIGQKRLAAKIENDLKKQLGPDAMEEFNKETPDANAFVKALKSANWSQWGVRWKTVAKIVLAVACAVGVIGGTVFSGGLALGIPLLILGVSGLLWIVLTDGAAFKSEWESGDVRKRDKFLVYFSLALSLVAIGTLIAFTVLSGGAPIYIAGIVFAAAWLIINAYALYMVVDNMKHPWKYQKEVTIQAFRQFLATKPSDEELGKVYSKMSLANRKGVTEEFIATVTLEKAAESWENHLKDLRAESLDVLMDSLTAASEAIRYEVIAS